MTATDTRPAETEAAIPANHSPELGAERRRAYRQEVINSASLDQVLSRMTVQKHMDAHVEINGTDLDILVGYEYTVRIDGLIETDSIDENNAFWNDFTSTLDTALEDVMEGRDERHEPSPAATGSIGDEAVDLIWKLAPEAFRAALEDHPGVALTQWAERQDADA